MAQFEETRRIDCANALGRHIVIIEQKKWPRYSILNKPLEPVYDYLTEDGQVASKLGDEFLLLLTDEIYHVA